MGVEIIKLYIFCLPMLHIEIYASIGDVLRILQRHAHQLLNRTAGLRELIAEAERSDKLILFVFHIQYIGPYICLLIPVVVS